MHCGLQEMIPAFVVFAALRRNVYNLLLVVLSFYSKCLLAAVVLLLKFARLRSSGWLHLFLDTLSSEESFQIQANLLFR